MLEPFFEWLSTTRSKGNLGYLQQHVPQGSFQLRVSINQILGQITAYLLFRSFTLYNPITTSHYYSILKTTPKLVGELFDQQKQILL